MDKHKILIAEDDGDINHLLCRLFSKEGYGTIQAFSGTEAKLLLQMEAPDLLVLDLMLPGMTGEEVIKTVREEMGLTVPILVLSAKAGLASKVDVLKMGADDYLTKPFEGEEVLARVYALLRRCSREGKNTGEEAEQYTYKKLQLLPQARKAVIDGQEIALTMHEFDILYILIKEPQKVYSRESLYEHVWKGGYYGEDNTVNVHVSNLRKKIAECDPAEEYIKTVWGIGFKMA